MFDLPVFLASPRPGARRAAHGKRGDQNEGCDLNDTETLPTTQRCVHGSGMSIGSAVVAARASRPLRGGWQTGTAWACTQLTMPWRTMAAASHHKRPHS